MDKLTILVCGAYGQAGVAVIEDLIKNTDYNIIASGRSIDKLNALKKQYNSSSLSTAILDVKSKKDIKKYCSVSDVLVNCIGPYLKTGIMIAKIALETKTHYLDIAAEQEHYKRFQNLSDLAKKNGVALGTGFGFYPGLSGLLLLKMKQLFPEADSCLMSLFQGRPTNKNSGAASYIGAVLEMNYDMFIIENGSLARVLPCEKRIVDLPEPFGEQDTMTWSQMEILSLKDELNLQNFETSIKIGVSPIPSRTSVQLIRFLKPHKNKFTFNFLSYLMRKRNAKAYQQSKKKGIDRRAIVFISLKSLKNKLEGYMIANSEQVTSYLLVRAIPLIVERNIKGLITPDLIFNPEMMLKELQEVGASLVDWHIETRSSH
jgi:hypothetical protein